MNCFLAAVIIRSLGAAIVLWVTLALLFGWVVFVCHVQYDYYFGKGKHKGNRKKNEDNNHEQEQQEIPEECKQPEVVSGSPIMPETVVPQKNVSEPPPMPELAVQHECVVHPLVIGNEYELAMDYIISGKKCVFIQGGAGTGKSTLIRELVQKNLVHVVLAPTGVAALNVDGQTIHKFFGLKPVNLFPKTEIHRAIPRDARAVLERKPTICIDEISMVRADLIDHIDRALRAFFETNTPFGGCQMVFVGDLYQLPPIVHRDVKMFFDPSNPQFSTLHGWKSEWFFDAEVFSQIKGKKEVTLTKNFRQQNDVEFLQRLNDLRVYRKKWSAINYFNLNIDITRQVPDNTTIIAGTNIQVDTYNQKRLNLLEGSTAVFHAQYNGVFEKMSHSDYPNDIEVELKVGAFVMFVYNDPNKQFVNGTSGVVKSICSDYVVVELADGRLVNALLHTWEAYEVVWNKDCNKFENIVVGTFTQIPVKLAWAITAHKSQGKTLDSIYIDMQAWAPGQMYVALSRVRNIRDISARKHITGASVPVCHTLANRSAWS